jgi:hypothetical protein
MEVFNFNNVRSVNMWVCFDTSPAMNDPRAQPYFTNGFSYMMAEGSHFCVERTIGKCPITKVYVKV